MMMVVPVDADENEAQCIAEEGGYGGTQGRQRCIVRNVQIEDHDRDDDGDHAVAERFESPFAYVLLPSDKYGRAASYQAAPDWNMRQAQGLD